MTTTTKRRRGRPRYNVSDKQSAKVFQEFATTITLARDGERPLWVQLKNQIEEGILLGSLPAQTRMPSEQAMCEIFGLSRTVIRSALHALSAEGHIIKQPRKGIYVAAPTPQIDFLTSTLSVFDDMALKGYKVTVRTYHFGLDTPTDKERQAFGLPKEFEIIRIVRVYFADGIPLTHTNIALPAHRLPDFERVDIEGKSIFGTIRELYGLNVARADRWLKAVKIPVNIAKRMKLDAETSVMLIESIAYDHDGQPLEVYNAYYNSEVAPIQITASNNKNRSREESQILHI